MSQNKKTKTRHPAAFKAQVALEALKELETIPQISSKFGIHPTQIRRWRETLQTELPNIFVNGVNKQIQTLQQENDELYHRIGQLTMQMEWLKKKLGLITR